MPATGAAIGYGSKLAIGDGAVPEVFSDVAEVTSITPPSDSIDVIDATHMQSPNKTREFIEGLIDPGECSFDINFVPGGAADTAIQALKGTGVHNFRITFAPGDAGSVTWDFAGILTGYEPDVPVDDKMTATVTIKVTSSYTTGVAA
ncbi:MAG TPA: phage tail tube protein [Rhizobiaceae bacterium]|nr:phage tail tube protein [Rhizobiaceae bacterium]